MDEELKINGKWWLPDTPETPIVGELTFIPGKTPRLVLQGSLQVPKDKSSTFFIPAFINPEVIHGVEIPGGKPITLLHCQQTGSKGIGEDATSSFIARIILRNWHERKMPAFPSIYLRFMNLEEWANRKPLAMKHYKDAKEHLAIHYRSEPSLSVSLPDFDLIFHWLGPNWSREHINRMELSFSSEIEIVFKDKTKKHDYLQIIRKLQNFFGLVMGGTTYPTGIKGVLPEDKSLFVEMYYALPSWPEETVEQRSYNMLFPLPTNKKIIMQWLENWFKYYEELMPAINLYFLVLYNPGEFLDMKFLFIVQGLETFHRRFFGGEFMDKKKYQTEIGSLLTAAIPQNLPEEFSDALKSKINYGNEYSLKKRLLDILENCAGVLPLDFVLDVKRSKSFVKQIVDTRNNLTHHEKGMEKRALKPGLDMFIGLTRLQLLLETLLLKAVIGDDDLLKATITRSEHYQILKSFSD